MPTTKNNPPRDPIYHGVFETEPPAKALDGDTCVLASAYHPDTYEVLVYAGAIVGGKYQEMWFASEVRLPKERAVTLAKSLAA